MTYYRGNPAGSAEKVSELNKNATGSSACEVKFDEKAAGKGKSGNQYSFDIGFCM